MKYLKGDRDIRVGDVVNVEGNVRGLVVCDFDNWLCAVGYDSWLTKEEMVGGGRLDKGVLIETEDLGMLYYAEPDQTIEVIA
ncbi:MAG: hypothetical protein HOP03_08540 [Lysobacter sp.]|nr:hypothetical protein [Lysobacter sp.]